MMYILENKTLRHNCLFPNISKQLCTLTIKGDQSKSRLRK
jgi:hypothetical protein